MKHRVLRVIGCLLILLAVPFSLLAAAFGLPAQYGETYLAALSDKWERLQSAPGPRIVVVGGSGVCFDLRSDLLEQELPDYSIVNFGLYAGLGTTVMLDLCLPELREGDILIFAPELNDQTYSTYFGAEAMWQAADGNASLLRALPAERRGAMLGAFPAFAAAKARLYLENAAPKGEGVYARASFNDRGDIACPGREQNTMPGGWDQNMPLRFDSSLPTEEFLAVVNAAAARCEEKGVRFYFRFCPMNADAADNSSPMTAQAFEQSLSSRLSCPLLGRIDEALLAPQWFFDTNFHLNASGAVLATAQLARDLKAELGLPASVGIALPEMPPLAGTALVSGDLLDEDCFVYAESAEGYTITALSESGREKTELTVPVSHAGRPVTDFEAAVFAGNTALRELRLQENLRFIPDAAFSGCTSLERIVLTQSAPSACSVGKGLLDGTEALVYVPAESLSAYCTNYFWAVHAARLRAAESTQPQQKVLPAAPVPGGSGIRYLANGGALRRGEGDSITSAMDHSHLRVNTLQGAAYFAREGYVLTGWNTAADGSGEHIGLGSRTERAGGLTLFAEWAQALPAEVFRYSVQGKEIRIEGYRGGSARCVIPEELDGLPVRRICSGAFTGCELTELVFPSSLRCVEPGAFTDCQIDSLTMFDSLTDMDDAAFSACDGPLTLRVNAAVSPVYSGSYYDTFSDKYDWLLSVRDERKIVLASGSSGRYGYDSEAIDRAFPDFTVANMGVYAYSNALPQLELIRPLMRRGDILLSAPEFDAVAEQFCTTNRLDAHFWAMMESNYDMLAALDLREFSGVFDSYAAYQRTRGGMVGRSYSVSPANYDDDGNYYAFSTYNRYGDFILPRPNGDQDVRLRSNIADYTTASLPAETVESLNRELRRFEEDGVVVYFSYTPRNRSSLTDESTPQARAELHRYLCESLCVPVISELEDSLLSGVYFWLIDSHTSTEGAAIRTRQIIVDLKAQGIEK